jgi:hypothetical protein
MCLYRLAKPLMPLLLLLPWMLPLLQCLQCCVAAACNAVAGVELFWSLQAAAA